MPLKHFTIGNIGPADVGITSHSIGSALVQGIFPDFEYGFEQVFQH